MKSPLPSCTKILFVTVVWFAIISPVKADVSIAYRTDCAQLNFAVARLGQALRKANETPVVYDLAPISCFARSNGGDKDIFIVADETEAVFSAVLRTPYGGHLTVLPGAAQKPSINPLIKQDGFQIAKKVK